MAAKRKPQKTPEEFVNDVKTVVSASVSRSIQLMTRANDLINDAVQTVSAPDRKAMDNSEVMERWLYLNVATYSLISDHALSMLDKLITVAEGALVGEIPGVHGAEKLVDIEVSGSPGEKCSAGFSIQNHYDHALDISLEATPLIAEGAAPLPSSHISFDPVSTRIDPRKQKIITLTIDIGKDFVPGKTYVSSVHVIGYESKELILSVHVLPPTADKPRSTRAKTRSAKKKTKASSGKSTKKRAVKKKKRKAS